MSNPDYLQSLRDLAQAEQMRSAAESAQNSRKLLEAQEKQAELEKQKLHIEQIRLQEERERHQALLKKAEAQKTIRIAMAGVEEELDLLLRRANSAQKHQSVDGLPAVAFFFLLVRRKLGRVILSHYQLEDLGDIRFARSLEVKFEEIKELYPNYFGESIIHRTGEVFRRVAFWAHETKFFHGQDISLVGFLNESDATIEAIARRIEVSSLSTAIIDESIESIQQLKQKTLIAHDRITEAWNIREGLASELRSYQFGYAELSLTADSELDPNADELLVRNFNHQSRIKKLEASLLEAKADWIHDRDLLVSAKKSRLEAKFGEMEKASRKFKRTTWTDLDVSGIHKALTQKRDSLVQEVKALGSNKTAAINLAQRLAVEYSSSATIADPLKNYQIKLMRELGAQQKRKRRTFTIAGLFVCLSIGFGLWLVGDSNLREVRGEKEFNFWVGLVVYTLIAGVLWLVYQMKEKQQNEQLAAADAKELMVRAFNEGMVTDEAGHALLLIPRGSFLMGSNDDYTFEKPVRSVKVSAFFMGETEVTYGEWKTVLVWAISKGYEFRNKGKGAGEKHPVTNVNWYDAVKWCNAKSEKEGLTACYKVNAGVYRKGEENGVTCDWNASGYRLPTEAEWEKAAGGGLTGKKFPNGDSLENKDANFGGTGTVDVSKYLANGYGLRDMAGNVWEWCWDWYGDYKKDVAADPKGSDAGCYRVVRGGGWNDSVVFCRVSCRLQYGPDNSYGSVGLRLVRRSGL